MGLVRNCLERTGMRGCRDTGEESAIAVLWCSGIAHGVPVRACVEGRGGSVCLWDVGGGAEGGARVGSELGLKKA
jgi:hypothetical protein